MAYITVEGQTSWVSDEYLAEYGLPPGASYAAGPQQAPAGAQPITGGEAKQDPTQFPWIVENADSAYLDTAAREASKSMDAWETQGSGSDGIAQLVKAMGMTPYEWSVWKTQYNMANFGNPYGDRSGPGSNYDMNAQMLRTLAAERGLGGDPQVSAYIDQLEQNFGALGDQARAQDQSGKVGVMDILKAIGFVGGALGGFAGLAGGPGLMESALAGGVGDAAAGAQGISGFGSAAGALPESSLSLADFAAQQGLSGGQGLQMTGSAANAFDAAAGLTPGGAATGGMGFALPSGAMDTFGGAFTGGGMAPTNYSLGAGSTMQPGGQGFNPNNLATEGLKSPSSPNLASMGGGQGLTVPFEGGTTVAEGGTFGPDYMPELGGDRSVSDDYLDRVKKKLIEKAGKSAMEKLFGNGYEYTEGAARYDQGGDQTRSYNLFKQGNLRDLFGGDIDALTEAALRELGFSVGRQGLQESSVEGEQIAGVEEEASKYYADVEAANQEAQANFGQASIEAALQGITAPESASAYAVEPDVPTFADLELVQRGGTPLPRGKKKKSATGASAPTPGEDDEYLGLTIGV